MSTSGIFRREGRFASGVGDRSTARVGAAAVVRRNMFDEGANVGGGDAAGGGGGSVSALGAGVGVCGSALVFDVAAVGA